MLPSIEHAAVAAAAAQEMLTILADVGVIDEWGCRPQGLKADWHEHAPCGTPLVVSCALHHPDLQGSSPSSVFAVVRVVINTGAAAGGPQANIAQGAQMAVSEALGHEEIAGSFRPQLEMAVAPPYRPRRAHRTRSAVGAADFPVPAA
ncbi:hypothetical protein PsYK624_011370 [Phanerochaete sordida]|uniref:Uncharacterized protein n=1 Tax=Phanerochaete sordida TaxID=48140 RepID=A0A9P3L7K2_9APHY|nr:hypothetical protein PsYK624_011370 [Phanerochaete sordida]